MELRLVARRLAVAEARHWVADRARELGLPERLVPVAELLTSELVANAVVHGPAGGKVTVRAERADGDLRVLVCDGSVDAPVLKDTPPEVPGGQGLRLVDRLASAWGVELGPPGKVVWFTIAVADPHGRQPP